MAKLDASSPELVLLVVVFCLIQQLLLEVPLLGYTFAPEKTQDRVARFRAWLGRNGRQAGVILARRDRRPAGPARRVTLLT